MCNSNRCDGCGMLGKFWPNHKAGDADCQEYQKIRDRSQFRCSMCLKPMDGPPGWTGGSLYCSHACAYA